jgi:PAS domain S-box-containing protein
MKELSNQIMDHLGQGLVILDLNGNFKYYNKKFLEMVEYTPEELEKVDLFSIASKMHGVDLKEKFKKRIQGEKESYEAVLTSKNNRVIPVLISGAPYYDEHGNIDGVISLFTDISKSKELEEQLTKAAEEAKKANEAKSKFLGNISHEIKNPLNGMIGIIDLLRESTQSKEDEELLKTMRESSYHILNMLDELLDLSKIESNKMDLDLIKFSPLKIYNSLYLSYKSNLYSKNIDFEVDYDNDIPDNLCGDPMRLRQILDNLLSNAFKFTKKGSVSMLFSLDEIKENTAYLRISISDTGIGINKHNLKSIFEAFTQGELSIKEKFGGTGLGLFIVKKLLDLMNGEIKIESAKNVGTKAILKIPFKISNGGSQKNSNDKSSINVLYIDDNEVNLMTIGKICDSYGYNLKTALNGKEGLKYLKEKDYDLIFVDSEMPIMNGIETINLIKSSKHFADNSYIVYCSNKDIPPNQLKDLGVNDLLIKPINKSKINKIINNFLKNS